MTSCLRAALAIGVLGVSACSGTDKTPTAPSSVLQPIAPVSPIPAGFRLAGFVVDTAFRPVAGIAVTVVDGPDAGLSAMSDADGRFELTGRFDSTTLFHAAGDGYVAATQGWRCVVTTCGPSTGATPSLVFYLAGVEPPVNIAGDYTLTFVADSTCTDLPEGAGSRSYRATIGPGSTPNIPAGSSFDLVLSGAPFYPGFNTFAVGVAGRTLTFNLHGGHDAPVAEQLADNTYLAFSGGAVAEIGSPTLTTVSAPFAGWIQYCASTLPLSGYYNCLPARTTAFVHCESTGHRLILSRR